MTRNMRERRAYARRVVRGCDRHRIIDVERYGDDVPVPWFGPWMRCERCGHLSADARLNWGELAARGRVGYNEARLG
jgi:hypothetical protein